MGLHLLPYAKVNGVQAVQSHRGDRLSAFPAKFGASVVSRGLCFSQSG